MKRCSTCGNEYETANTLCPNDGTVLERVGDDLIGQTLAGKYRIEEHMSDGGMGAVYRATHVLMDKTVAIKVLHPSLAADDNIVARFTREAKAASRISHPHALNVTDFGESEAGVVFLVMEYLRGETLKEIIRRNGPMPLERVAEIVRQVGGALNAAHAEGVVHRDLKSDNIMLDEIGVNQDWAKVLDFGIAKIQEPEGHTDPALTAPNLVIGTPQYMSPEQCSHSSNIDARSDIYSFGIIIYEMLTGHVPFTGDSPTAIMMKQIQDEPPSVLTERPDLPPAVGTIIARALSKKPEDRFDSAGELAEALADAVIEEGTETEPAFVAATEEIERNEIASGNTDRIVVPTAANDMPRATTSEEQDEATILHPSLFNETERNAQAAIPPPSASFNPMRITIPAIIFVIGLFVVVYALTRDSDPQPAGNEQVAPLTSDPNSQPAQPLGSPSGASERNIAPRTPTNSTAVGGNANALPSDPLFGTTTNDNTIDPLSSLPSPDNTNTAANTNNSTTGEQGNPVTSPSSEEDVRPSPTPRSTPPILNSENPLPSATPSPRRRQSPPPPPPPSSDADRPPQPSTESPPSNNAP